MSGVLFDAEKIAHQLAEQAAHMRQTLAENQASLEEFNRTISSAITGRNWTPAASVAPEDMALLKAINQNPDLKKAVMALAKGFATSAPQP